MITTITFTAAFLLGILSKSTPTVMAATDPTRTMGTQVTSTAAQRSWWQSLTPEEQQILANLFDDAWWSSIDETTQIAYADLADSLYEFVGSNADSHPHDFYVGFAPLLLRASFHSSGTYQLNGGGTGGSNGGTIFHPAELEDDQNGCIDLATTELASLFHGHEVPLADAVVIAGVVALHVMDFPRMDLVKVVGGRTMYDNMAFRGRLPSPDDDPLALFQEQYGFTWQELVALIGGAHNFGAARGTCSGYVGQWTSTPLSWFGPDGSLPTFFTDLLKEDWRWYEVCTYTDNTTIFTSIEDPFANGLPEAEEEEEGGGPINACFIQQSIEPTICEEQAMRGCAFDDGRYGATESPCDVDLLQFRLKSDFFLKANPDLRPFTVEFASNPDLLAEQFGIAYHKLTHNGLDRCGLSGFGCSNGTTCQRRVSAGDTIVEECVLSNSLEEDEEPNQVDKSSAEGDDKWSLGHVASIAVVCLLLIAVFAGTTALTTWYLLERNKKARSNDDDYAGKMNNSTAFLTVAGDKEDTDKS